MASPIQTSDAWVRARDKYVEDLNDEEQQMFFQASPETLLDDVITAEKSHGSNDTTRKVMKKLEPFVEAIVQYGDAVDVYSSTYSLALGPIWGSIKILIHIAREFSKYFDKLVDMFARIGDVLPRFRTYERLFSNHEPLIQALSMAYLDIITFCTSAKAVFRRGQRSSKTTFKVTFKLLWKPFDQQFGQQLGNFRQHQKRVEKEAGLVHMIESADARAMVLANQEQLEKRRREDSRLRILTMLNAVDYEAKQRKLRNLRHAGTGDWLFQQASYVEWETPGSSALLCCRGIPGCGKTILTSNIVDRLISSTAAPAALASDVVYYYCDYADQRTLDLDRILGSLLKQLFMKHHIPEQIETQLLQIYAGGTRSPAETALSNVFCSLVALSPNIYIVFDGLDECEKSVWQAMLRILKNLGAVEQSNVSIFITCVDEGSVSHHSTDFVSVQLSAAAANKDIEALVTSSVRLKVEDKELRIRNPKLEEEIVFELISKANGMFLWVFFQLQDLCESSSDAIIRETLRNLPEGLGDTYKRILHKIGQTPSRVKLAQNVFEWAAVAKRPLHVEELREAVGIDPNDRAWEGDNFPHEDLMFESCRGLIIKDVEDETVHFAHHTVRQYLTGGLATKVDPLFEVGEENANFVVGHIALLLAAANGNAAVTRTLLDYDVSANDFNGSLTALHIAAESGHSAVVQLLLQYGADPSLRVKISKEYSGGETAFSLAAKGGHVNVLQLMYELLRNVFGQQLNNLRQTPLHLAVAECRSEAIRWLVEHGAFIDSIDDCNGTPLSFATKLGNENIVRLLLELGVTTIGSIDVGCNIISNAFGNLPILEMLLKNIGGGGQNLSLVHDMAIVEALNDARARGNMTVADVLSRYRNRLSYYSYVLRGLPVHTISNLVISE